MQERQSQHFEPKATEGLIPELNREGFVILEDNNSFLGRLGKFFADKIKPTTRKIVVPASVVLLSVTAFACSQGEASVNNVQISYLPTATMMSEIGEPEAIRRTSPPARVTDESNITFPARLQLPEGTRVVIGK